MSNPSVAGLHISGSPQDNKGPPLLGTLIAFTAIATITVGLRLSVRLCILKSPGWDDASIVLAIALAIVSTTSWCIAIEHGWGRHITFISESNLATSIKWNLVATVTFYISLIFSKISVAALFLRILGQTRTVRKTAFLYSMMALATIIGFIGAGYCTGQCSPIAKDWRHSIPGKCHGNISLKIGVAQGAINAFIDFALAFFPITFLLNSSINARKKAVIWLLMSCGMVAGVCSIARVVVSTVRNDSGDFTYVETIHTYLAISEEGVSIVLACLPTLLPLGRLIRDRTCFRRHGTNRQTTKNSTSWPSERKRSYPSPDPYAMDMEDYTAVKSATTIQKTSTFGVTFGSEVDLIQAIGDGRRTDVRGGEIPREDAVGLAV